MLVGHLQPRTARHVITAALRTPRALPAVPSVRTSMLHKSRLPAPVPNTAASGQSLSDAELAATLALAAGNRLQELRRQLQGLTSEALKARGDAEAQGVLASGLAAARPSDAVLSEEAADDPARLTASRVWIVDPLDGTR